MNFYIIMFVGYIYEKNLLDDGQIDLLGILDGHGGDFIRDKLKEILPNQIKTLIIKYRTEKKDYSKIDFKSLLNEAFKSTNDYIFEKFKDDGFETGSTATICLFVAYKDGINNIHIYKYYMYICIFSVYMNICIYIFIHINI